MIMVMVDGGDAVPVKAGDIVSIADAEFEAPGCQLMPHGPMVGVYDEAPSLHVDYVKPESLQFVRPYSSPPLVDALEAKSPGDKAAKRDMLATLDKKDER